MGRKPGSKNKPKFIVVGGNPEHAPIGSGPESARGPGPGHNLSDDQKRLLFLQGLSQIERIQSEIDTLVAKKRNVYKIMKSEGTAREEISYALYLRKSEPEEALAKRAEEAKIARWMAHPIGAQAELFGDEVENRPVDGPYEFGKSLGMLGRPMDELFDKWHENSPEGQKAMEGWHESQAIIIAGIQQKADEDSPIIGRGIGMPSAPTANDDDDEGSDDDED